MPDANWDLLNAVLRQLQADMADVKTTLAEHGSKLDSIDLEVKGLKRMSQMALGTASGADFIAERAEKLAETTNKRLDDLIAALKRKEIDVDA